MTRLMICNCRKGHSQPTGVRAGCGRYWLGTLIKGASDRYELRVERDISWLSSANALQEAQTKQAEHVQHTAEKWLGGITAIYGLFSLAGLATAKDALTRFSTLAKWGIAVALTTGLALAGTAILFGYLAAYGWPGLASVSDNKKLQAWDVERRAYAMSAVGRLRLAIFFSLGAITALTVMMFLMWFLPRAAE